LHYHNLGILCIYYHIFCNISWSSNQLKELKSIISYLFAPITRFKKGMIAYKMANRFMHFKHIEIAHWQVWNEWIEWKKDGAKRERQPTKKNLALPLKYFF
jgi:hypothetical protein